jgi:phage terminase large subunit-like protein
VIGNSLAKRAGGTELNFTTPDDADPESLLGKMYAYGLQVAAGEIDDPSFLFVHYGAPEKTKLKPPDQMTDGIARSCAR